MVLGGAYIQAALHDFQLLAAGLHEDLQISFEDILQSLRDGDVNGQHARIVASANADRDLAISQATTFSDALDDLATANSTPWAEYDAERAGQEASFVDDVATARRNQIVAEAGAIAAHALATSNARNARGNSQAGWANVREQDEVTAQAQRAENEADADQLLQSIGNKSCIASPSKVTGPCLDLQSFSTSKESLQELPGEPKGLSPSEMEALIELFDQIDTANERGSADLTKRNNTAGFQPGANGRHADNSHHNSPGFLTKHDRRIGQTWVYWMTGDIVDPDQASAMTIIYEYYNGMPFVSGLLRGGIATGEYAGDQIDHLRDNEFGTVLSNHLAYTLGSNAQQITDRPELLLYLDPRAFFQNAMVTGGGLPEDYRVTPLAAQLLNAGADELSPINAQRGRDSAELHQIAGELLAGGIAGGGRSTAKVVVAKLDDSTIILAELVEDAGGALKAAPRGTAGLTQRAPTWNAYPASLPERLAAYKQWKASAGIGKPTQAEFRRFVGAHRPNSRGSTLYFEDGGFAAWSKRVGSTHGNTAGSQAAWLYRLESDTGEFLKWGISQDPMTRYSQSFMLDKHIIPIQGGPRRTILQVERDLVERMPGPLNFERWQGTRLGQ